MLFIHESNEKRQRFAANPKKQIRPEFVVLSA